MAIERRRYSRIEIEWPVTLITAHSLVGGITQNLSLVGTLIRCSAAPNLDDRFRLVFKPAGRQLLLATAEMVWSDSFLVNTSKLHAVGLRFAYVPEHDYQRISQVLEKAAS
jgi:hypothetical protein